MQQTCRDVSDFIRTSKNISVTFNDSQEIGFNKEKSLWYLVDPFNNRRMTELDVLYGMRIDSLSFSVHNFLPSLNTFLGSKEAFEELYAALKNNRITCGSLSFTFLNLSKEQHVLLLDLLKATRISVHSIRSTVYEAVFESKILVSPCVWFLFVFRKM